MLKTRYMNINSTSLSFCSLLFHQYLAKINLGLPSAHIHLGSKSGKPKLKLNKSKALQNSTAADLQMLR
jgi:hypothetical protein